MCTACNEELDETFSLVKQYLAEHKQATLAEVVVELEVDSILVAKLIHEGRLYLVDNPNFGINCGRCGTLTNAGSYCKKCQEDMAKQFANATVNSFKKRQEADHHDDTGYFTR